MTPNFFGQLDINDMPSSARIQADNLGGPIELYSDICNPRIVEVKGVKCVDWDPTPDPGNQPAFGEQEAFEAILRLNKDDPESVAAFVGRFGVFDICRHDQVGGCKRCGRIRVLLQEPFKNYRKPQPIDWYLHAGREFRATMGLAMAARKGKPGEVEDWECLRERNKWIAEKPTMNARLAVAEHVNHWLMEAGNLGLAMVFGKAGPEIVVTGNGLLAALARQLALTVAGVDRLYKCDSCGTPYVPRRAPAKGRSHYCDGPDCGLKAARRDASRRYRAQAAKRKRKR